MNLENLENRFSSFQFRRQLMALMLSVVLIPTAQMDLYAQAPAAYVDLNADQLDQIVAPIALYPDSLVASILTASTYPDQIGGADAWLNQNMNLPPAQRAAGADVQPWDPSVKALIEFPAVLDNLAKNSAWTSQLGNAYFNQPGDVENAVQAMRLQAQQSGRLVATPQQAVTYTNGIIAIAPVNPAVVYVPYYNPWVVWGGFVNPWPGWYAVVPPPGVVLGVGLAFGVGISMAVYGGFGWGFHAWAPAWGGGGVFYGGRTYVSNSVTVYNHGNFGGHDRGVFEHGGRGVPAGFHASAHAGAARAAAERAGVRGGSPRAGGFGGREAGRSAFAGGGRGANAAAARAGARAGAAAGARAGAASGARSGGAAGARSGARTGGATGARAGGAAGARAGGATGARAGGAAGARTGGATGARAGGAAGGRAGGATGARAGGAAGARAGGGAGARAGGAGRAAPAARAAGGGGGRPAGGGGRPAGGGGGRPAGGGGGHPAGGGGGGGHHK